jgi:hypothetical protein
MRTCLNTLVIVSALLLPLPACKPRTVAVKLPPPQAKVEGILFNPKEADKTVAKLPDVIGLPREVYRDGGPQIMIWVNGELYVDTSLRDNQEVSGDQLGNYLARVLFKNTKKVSIRADDGDPKKAILKAKFELGLRVSRPVGEPLSPDILRISFEEMRFKQALYDPGAWVLTAEAIELIEKAVPQKKSD